MITLCVLRKLVFCLLYVGNNFPDLSLRFKSCLLIFFFDGDIEIFLCSYQFKERPLKIKFYSSVTKVIDNIGVFSRFFPHRCI